jgi:hypothetical protein
MPAYITAMPAQPPSTPVDDKNTINPRANQEDKPSSVILTWFKVA